jgi:hypothetical protein
MSALHMMTDDDACSMCDDAVQAGRQAGSRRQTASQPGQVGDRQAT